MSEGQTQFTKESDGNQSGKSELQDYEDSVNFPPGVTQPSWPLTDLRRSKPTPPPTPPPMHVVRRFKQRPKPTPQLVLKEEALGQEGWFGQGTSNWTGNWQLAWGRKRQNRIGKGTSNWTGNWQLAWEWHGQRHHQLILQVKGHLHIELHNIEHLFYMAGCSH